ncbi:hypothetical protein FHQ07_01570 [Thermomonas aquatica]|uniref:Uncharacterized protein n=1 Tax=Thermomonas aquatica TaxID=2202149 RepID=A0A5B7ZQT7_9GAMM|nr:hypothetical protein FHQ07_01570 [Thermomonas aquatica]
MSSVGGPLRATPCRSDRRAAGHRDCVLHSPCRCVRACDRTRRSGWRELARSAGAVRRGAPGVARGRRIRPEAMEEGYGLPARLSTGPGLQCVQRFTE